jgi:hypothetical protein
VLGNAADESICQLRSFRVACHPTPGVPLGSEGFGVSASRGGSTKPEVAAPDEYGIGGPTNPLLDGATLVELPGGSTGPEELGS